MGIIALSDASGQFEGVLFSEALQQYRDVLEPGSAVVLLVAAEDRPEGMSLRIQSAEPLEAMARDAQKAMRVYLNDDKPIDSLLRILGSDGKSEVSLVMIRDGGAREVELLLPRKYNASSQIAAAVKAVQGVVAVELV